MEAAMKVNGKMAYQMELEYLHQPIKRSIRDILLMGERLLNILILIKTIIKLARKRHKKIFK